MKKLLVVLLMLAAMSVSAQWVQMSNGMGSNTISSFAVSGTNIFAGTYYGGTVYRSSNDGLNWMATGLTGQLVMEFAVSGTNIFAGTYGGGIYLSTNNGTNWIVMNNGLTDHNVYSLAVIGSNIFAGTLQSGVFLSTNNGASWNTVNNGLPQNSYINSFAVIGTKLFASSHGVYLSTNNGTNWTSVNNGLSNLSTKKLAVSGTNLFVGTYLGGVYLSTNYGTNWTTTNNELTNSIVLSLVVSGTNIFAGVVNSGVYLSTNNGINWINKNQGFNNVMTVFPLIILNNYIFAGRDSQSVWRRSLSEIIGIQNISTETPAKYSLSQNYPNPFNPTCNVQFSMYKAGQVKLVVYDVQGREVQTLVNEKLSAGTYEVKFDGSMLNSGVYFYKMMTDGFTETKRMILIK